MAVYSPSLPEHLQKVSPGQGPQPGSDGLAGIASAGLTWAVSEGLVSKSNKSSNVEACASRAVRCGVGLASSSAPGLERRKRCSMSARREVWADRGCGRECGFAKGETAIKGTRTPS